MCCFACRGVICGSGGILWSALLPGHRPEKLPWGSRETDPRCCALKIQLDRAVRAAWEAGATTFACGLARGCNFYFAEAVLRLQEQAEGISLEAWIPCPEQPNRWKEPDQARYRTLLTRCSRSDPRGGTGVCPGLHAAPEPGHVAGGGLAHQRLRWQWRRDRCSSGLCQPAGPAGGSNLAVISRAFPIPGPRHWQRCL